MIQHGRHVAVRKRGHATTLLQARHRGMGYGTRGWHLQACSCCVTTYGTASLQLVRRGGFGAVGVDTHEMHAAASKRDYKRSSWCTMCLKRRRCSLNAFEKAALTRR